MDRSVWNRNRGLFTIPVEFVKKSQLLKQGRSLEIEDTREGSLLN